MEGLQPKFLPDVRKNHSWWIHLVISHFNQCSTTGTAKAMVYAILPVGWVHIKDPLPLTGKNSSGGSRFRII